MSVAVPLPEIAAPRRSRNPLVKAWRKLIHLIKVGFEVSNFLPDGTKDIRVYLKYPGSSPGGRWLARWGWKYATHRLTRAGHWFFYATLFLGVFASVSLEIKTYIPFLYSMAFWFIAGLFALFSKPNVAVKARHAPVVSAGEALLVDAEITSLRRGGLFPAQDVSLVPFGLPAEVDAVAPAGTPIGTLTPGETVRIQFSLKPNKRGVFTLPGYRVDTDFPLGIMNAYRRVEAPSALTVYPSFTPLREFALPSGTGWQEGGVALLAKQGDSFEYWGNREWREGDSQRDIDWRATARLGGNTPIAREWREEYFFRVGIVLDTYLPRATGKWLGLLYGARAYDPPKEWASAFERAVSLSAAVADYMAREQYIVDIFAAGPTFHHLTVGRGAGSKDEILNILAGVSDTQGDVLTAIEPELLESVSRLTTVICVFLQYDERRRQFVELLRSTGVGVKVIVVPPLPRGMEDEDEEAAPGVVSAPEPDTVIVDAATFKRGVDAL
ncbi:MAG: DUF58 domain-containing protein [Armatimonadetes bacterium]|nr:DUF58 domain-containing protein [Armatimonadota bacterium]